MTAPFNDFTDEQRAKPLRIHRDQLRSDVEESPRLDAPVELRVIRGANVLRAIQAAFITDRGITISLEVDESVHLAADEVLLTQAVSALLHTAVKLSADGARVFLSCRAVELGVAIEVEDERVAFAPRKSREVQASRADRVEALGQGLRTARRVGAAMGGDLFVESHPERGRTFALRFQSSRAPSSSAPPPPRPDASP